MRNGGYSTSWTSGLWPGSRTLSTARIVCRDSSHGWLTPREHPPRLGSHPPQVCLLFESHRRDRTCDLTIGCLSGPAATPQSAGSSQPVCQLLIVVVSGVVSLVVSGVVSLVVMPHQRKRTLAFVLWVLAYFTFLLSARRMWTSKHVRRPLARWLLANMLSEAEAAEPGEVRRTRPI